MADEEVQVEAPAEEIVDETPVETPTEEGTETPPEETEDPSPGEGEETEEGDEGGEEEEPAYKANTKFKAGVYNKESKQLEQKEYDIDPRFAGLMTDADSEKAVRELHEKAFGLESVKERFNEAKQEITTVRKENEGIKGSIDYLRNVYRESTKPGGNIHKMDEFFQRLQVPQEVLAKYMLAKIELNEMPPEQRNAILGQMETERQAANIARQRDELDVQNQQRAIELKNQATDLVLARPELAALSSAYDDRVGTPGSFKHAMFKEGMLAWQTEGMDISPQEAAQRVIKNYGLDSGKHNLPPAKQPGAGSQAAPNGKTVVQRTNKTIPNVGGSAGSPLAKGPKNMDELLKYRKEAHGF